MKIRRHHNNKGYFQCKHGLTELRLKQIEQKLRTFYPCSFLTWEKDEARFIHEQEPTREQFQHELLKDNPSLLVNGVGKTPWNR